MKTPDNLQYTRTHEWVRPVGDEYEIGLTDYAQSELGDIVFVNLPRAGDKLTAGETFADVESVKAVSDIYSPLDGEVTAANEKILDEPALVNQAPYETWLIKAKGAIPAGTLIPAKDYQALTEH